MLRVCAKCTVRGVNEGQQEKDACVCMSEKETERERQNKRVGQIIREIVSPV